MDRPSQGLWLVRMISKGRISLESHSPQARQALGQTLHELAAGQQVLPSRKIWEAYPLSTMVSIQRFKVNGETGLRTRGAVSKSRFNSGAFLSSGS